MEIGDERFYKPWFLSDFIFDRSKYFKERQHLAKSLVEDVLAVKLDDLFNKEKSVKCTIPYFDALSQSNIEMQQFCDNACFFFAVSVESTSTALVSTLLLLAIHTDVQEKLYKQVSSVLNSSGNRVTETEMAQMPYLEQIIKESLRILPVLPYIYRETSAPLKLKKFTVPAGSNLLIRIYDLHVNEKNWGDDAKDFNPDRFEPCRIANINSHAFVPFASGPRMCPGYKHSYILMKVMLSRLIMEYKLTTDIKFNDIEWTTTTVVMKIKNEPLIKFSKRT